MDSLNKECLWVGVSRDEIAPGLAIQNAGANKMVKTLVRWDIISRSFSAKWKAMGCVCMASSIIRNSSFLTHDRYREDSMTVLAFRKLNGLVRSGSQN